MFIDPIEPSDVIGGCISVYKNIYPDTKLTIRNIENECSNPDSGFGWTKATTIGGGSLQNDRTNYDLGISSFAQITGNVVLKNVHNQFYLLLESTLLDYRKRFLIDEPLIHEPYNMLKYSGGQSYTQHSDGGPSSGRIVSAIAYLNDDYEGGDLEFVNFGIKIKPSEGDLYLFPSNYAYSHIAHPVYNGTKYAIVTWTGDIK